MARFLLVSAVQDELRCLAKEHSLKTRVVLIALGLAGYGLFGTLTNDWAHPVAVEEATHGVSIEAPASLPRSIAALPTVTPPEMPPPPRAGYAAASLPSLEPLRAVAALPTVTPGSNRANRRGQGAIRPTRRSAPAFHRDRRSTRAVQSRASAGSRSYPRSAGPRSRWRRDRLRTYSSFHVKYRANTVSF